MNVVLVRQSSTQLLIGVHHAKTRSNRHNRIPLWGFFPRLYPDRLGLRFQTIANCSSWLWPGLFQVHLICVNMKTETEFDIETLPVKIDYVGETVKENNWKCDQWRISITSKAGFWSTDYFTGIGLRREVKGARAFYVKAYKTIGNKWVSAEPVKPKVADVLYSLFNDASASEMKDRKSTRLNSSHTEQSRMPSSA